MTHQGLMRERDGDMILGICVGYILFMVFEGAVIWFNFSHWIRNPSNLKHPPPPERYLHAGIHTFVAMVACGYILTSIWSKVDTDDNPLMDWYGYNNVCIVFDTPPASYIMPVFWFTAGYFIVRYAITDTLRLFHLPRSTLSFPVRRCRLNLVDPVVESFWFQTLKL